VPKIPTKQAVALSRNGAPAPLNEAVSGAGAGEVTFEFDAADLPGEIAFEIDVADREWLHSAVLYLSRRLGLMSEERASAIAAAAGVELTRAARKAHRAAEGSSPDSREAEALADLLSVAGLSRAEVAQVLQAAAAVEVEYNRTHDTFEVRAKPRK
jgi:hypothetical protein